MGEMRIKIEDEGLQTRITDLAKLHNRSVDEEVENLLQAAVPLRPKREDLRDIIESIRAMTPEGVKQTNAVEMLREDRSR